MPRQSDSIKRQTEEMRGQVESVRRSQTDFARGNLALVVLRYPASDVMSLARQRLRGL